MVVMNNYLSSYWLQYLAGISSSLSAISCGIHFGWSSPSVPILLSENSNIPITNDEGSWLAVAPLIVEVITCFITPIITKNISRKYTVLLTVPAYLLSWIIIGLSESFAVLILGRCVAGFGDNLTFTVVPMYISEVADPKIRGILGSLIPISVYLGMFAINAIGPLVTISMMAWIALTIPLVQFCIFIWMPDSPYYYLGKNQIENARSSLKRLRRTDNVDEELFEIEMAVKRQKSEPGKIWDLFCVKSNKKAVMIMIGVRTSQQLTGAAAFMFYTQYIFEQADTEVSPYYSVIIYCGLQLILSVISSTLIDHLGRRPMLIFSCGGSIIALVLETIYFYLKERTDYDVTKIFWLPIFAMLLYIFMFSSGYATIPFVLIGELFPTNVKAMALSFADVYFAVVATMITKLFQFTGDTYGMFVPFSFFSICTVFSLFFCIYCIPETKGLNLEEIQLKLKGIAPEEINRNKTTTKL